MIDIKKSNTAERLKEILSIKGWRATDLVNKCQPLCEKYNTKMGRNDVSQYLSAKVEPSQRKLSILAEALNTNEAWLMGYNVPIDKYALNDDVNELASMYIALNKEDQQKVIKYIKDLSDK